MTSTGLDGIDYLLGGGLPDHGVILLSGPAGIGKTTLLIGLLRSLAKRRTRSMFISAEQSLGTLQGWLPCQNLPRQVALRSIVEHRDILGALGKCRHPIAVVDALQSVVAVWGARGQLLAHGGPAAGRQVAKSLRAVAREKRMVIFVVGHMTNAGVPAGGPALDHICDAILTMNRIPGAEQSCVLASTKMRWAPSGLRAFVGLHEGTVTACVPLR